MGRRAVGVLQGYRLNGGKLVPVYGIGCPPNREPMVFQGWHILHDASGSSDSGSSGSGSGQRLRVYGRAQCNDELGSGSESGFSSGSGSGSFAAKQRAVGVFQGWYAGTNPPKAVYAVACCLGQPIPDKPKCVTCDPAGRLPRLLQWGLPPLSTDSFICDIPVPVPNLLEFAPDDPGDPDGCSDGSSSGSSSDDPGPVRCVWRATLVHWTGRSSVVCQVRGSEFPTPHYTTELVIRATANDGRSYCVRYRGPALRCDPDLVLQSNDPAFPGLLILDLHDGIGCEHFPVKVALEAEFHSSDEGSEQCCPGSSSSSGSESQGSLSGSGSGSLPPPPPEPSGSESSSSGSESMSSHSFSVTDVCGCCPDGAPVVWKVTVSGIINAGATDCGCDLLNGVHYVPHIGGCEWYLEIPGGNPDCFPPDGTLFIYLVCVGGSVWQLFLGDVLMDGIFATDFNCLGSNTFVFTQFFPGPQACKVAGTPPFGPWSVTATFEPA